MKYILLLFLFSSCVTLHYSNKDFPAALERVKRKAGDTLPIHRNQEHDIRQWRKGIHIDCKHP